jgi:AcrR family transcriptional regulator
MNAAPASLRERQAEQVRASVLEAAIAALETREAEDLSMADIAEAAGVSLRTLYRYFPDRAALLQAAGERLYADLGVDFEIAAPQDIASSFRDAARRLSARPKLARALVRSGAGRITRSGVRRQRVEAIRAALEPLAGTMDPDLARHAAAVITHLCSAAAWVAVADESGLPDAEAQEAVAWAIDVLVETLRQDAGGAPPRRLRPHPQ